MPSWINVIRRLYIKCRAFCMWSWQTARWHACCISTAAPRFDTVATSSFTKARQPVAYSIAKYRGDRNEFGWICIGNNLLSLKRK